MEETDNKFGYLIDYFTFTTLFYSPLEIIESLGLKDEYWEPCRGRYNHKFGMKFHYINIYYGFATEGYSSLVTCEMSGQGCRAFETWGTGNWDKLFEHVFFGSCNCTRVDIALDDHLGIIPFDRLIHYSMERDVIGDRVYFSGDFKKIKLVKSDPCSDASTIYWGSKSSDAYYRIYEKGKERGFKDSKWIRYELQLRNENAVEFVSEIARGYGKKHIGKYFLSFLMKKVRFVDPDSGYKELRKRPTLKEWEQFLEYAEKAKPFDKVTVDYNAHNLDNYVIHQAGQAIKTALLLNNYDAEQLIKRIDNHRQGKRLDKKYQQILDDGITFEESENQYKNYDT